MYYWSMMDDHNIQQKLQLTPQLSQMAVALQGYLYKRADRHMIPAVDNTNVDRSVATLHATVLGCLRHMSQVRPLLKHSFQRRLALQTSMQQHEAYLK